MFFANGNAAVFHDHEQVPILQEGWLLLFAHHLTARGEDPTDYELTLPDGLTWYYFKIPGGWNWTTDHEFAVRTKQRGGVHAD